MPASKAISFVFAGVVVAGVVACGERSAGVVTVPTTNASESATSMAGELIGTLGGDGNSCFWVDTGSGKVTVLWPRGYTALRDPLRLLDASGDEVAREGQTISIAGGVTGEGIASCGTAGTWLGARPHIVESR